jgi:hypothetical protein
MPELHTQFGRNELHGCLYIEAVEPSLCKDWYRQGGYPDSYGE